MNHIIQYELIVNNDVLEKAIPVYDNMYQTVDGTWKEWTGDFDAAFIDANQNSKVLIQSYKDWLKKTGGEGGNLESWLDAGTLDVDMVEVPDGVKIIGAYAFEKCDELRRVILPDSVREIEEYAFSECSSLEEIRLPEKMDYIGECAFFGCSALRQIKLPYGLIRLKEMVFAVCEKLEQVEIPYGVEKIEKRAFLGCTRLQRIELPDTLWHIGDYAFEDCISLSKLNLPDSLTELGKQALSGMTVLRRLRIPDGVTDIDVTMFTENLEYLEVDEKNFVYSSVNGMLFTKDRKHLLYCPQGRKGDVEVPEGTICRNEGLKEE